MHVDEHKHPHHRRLFDRYLFVNQKLKIHWRRATDYPVAQHYKNNPPQSTMSVKICDHFLAGKCTRGEKCKWSHSTPAIPSSTAVSSTPTLPITICEHFLNNKCKRGEKCKWSHATPAIPPPTATSTLPITICEHFLNNKCKRGEKCKWSHQQPIKPKSTKSKKSKQTCNHFLDGNCTRGDQCRFVHPTDQAKVTRKRNGLQYRAKAKDWLRYGAQLDNVMSVVKSDIGLVFSDAPLCTGHQAKCAKRKVDKPSAKSYGREYWCCHKVVTGQTKDNCGFFRWVSDDEKRRAAEAGEQSSSSGSRLYVGSGEQSTSSGGGEQQRASKRRKFAEEEVDEEEDIFLNISKTVSKTVVEDDVQKKVVMQKKMEEELVVVTEEVVTKNESGVEGYEEEADLDDAAIRVMTEELEALEDDDDEMVF